MELADSTAGRMNDWIEANETILPKDEIFVIHNNKVIATAKAIVCGADMNKMTSGSLAEVKKKLRVKK